MLLSHAQSDSLNTVNNRSVFKVFFEGSNFCTWKCYSRQQPMIHRNLHAKMESIQKKPTEHIIITLFSYRKQLYGNKQSS